MSDAQRVLFATWEGAGNNPPIVSLAGGLVARGHDVLVLGHESTRGRFEGVGCSFSTWASSFEPPFIRSFMEPEEEYEWVNEHVFFGTAYQDDLRPAIEEFEPDVVMVDMNLRYAILEAMRARRRLVVLCHIPYGALVGFEGDEDKLEEFKQAVRRDGLPEYVSRRMWFEMADSILVFSYVGFDPLSGEEAGKRVRHVGPLRATIIDRRSPERQYPDRPFVLVSLSTSDQNQSELLQSICDACGQLPVEGLVTTGPSVPADSLNTGPNVTAVEYSDHDVVLPDVDLLVTHAGHGTAIAGLKHGVPMLCIPLGRDQPFNAERVVELGLGCATDAESSTDQIRDLISSMLDDTGLKERAQSFATSLKTHPGVHEALNTVEDILARSRQS